LPDAKAQTIPDDSGKLIVTVTKEKRVYIGAWRFHSPRWRTSCAPTPATVRPRSLPARGQGLSYGDVVKGHGRHQAGWWKDGLIRSARIACRLPLTHASGRSPRHLPGGIAATLLIHACWSSWSTTPHEDSAAPRAARDMIVTSCGAGTPREKFWCRASCSHPSPSA